MLQVFNSPEGQEIRVIDEDGELLWVAKDVLLSLGYTWGGDRIAHVPEEWRGVRSVRTPSGDQNMATLTEQGLYFFLGRSDKPAALPFQKWIAGKVLPSIRKTGSYHTNPRSGLLFSSDPQELERLASLIIRKAAHLRGLEAIHVALETGVLPPVRDENTRMTPTERLEAKITPWVQEFVLPDADGISRTTTKEVLEGIAMATTRSNEVLVGRVLLSMGFEKNRARRNGRLRYLYARNQTTIAK